MLVISFALACRILKIQDDDMLSPIVIVTMLDVLVWVMVIVGVVTVLGGH